MKLVLYCSSAGLSAVIRTPGLDMSRALRRPGEPGVSGNDLCVRLKSDIQMDGDAESFILPLHIRAVIFP